MTQPKLSSSFFLELEKKILVEQDPYPHASIKDFLPRQMCEEISKDFKFPDSDPGAGIEDKVFQKTKRGLSKIELMPNTIQNLINTLNSKQFLSILEKKFNLKNLVPDPTLFGGGMHESFRGGYLKIHSDFVFIKKRKLKRMLNLLIYLNEGWQNNWGGSIELWTENMSKMFLKLSPHINNALIFRTDLESNHGFPDPIDCPENQSRKSIALYYYTPYEKMIKPTKKFYAIWKKRPGVDEKKFGDNLSFFKKLKNKIFFRF